MIVGWAMFAIIVVIDIALYALVVSYFDGTWDRIHNDY